VRGGHRRLHQPPLVRRPVRRFRVQAAVAVVPRCVRGRRRGKC
jgi:hypothetical protein